MPLYRIYDRVLTCENFWQDLAHWDEVSDRIQVGDSLESAIEKTTNEMKLLQVHILKYPSS